MNKIIETALFEAFSGRSADVNGRVMVKDGAFDSFEGDPRSAVLEIKPRKFADPRGWFMEVAKGDLAWIKQINRSASKSYTVRGCHAQKGEWCQAKLVEALTFLIFDIITDMRPRSKTFGVSKIYPLDPVISNQLFVPRGFLHGFIVPALPREEDEAIFSYCCDNVYNKASEISVNPTTLIPEIVKLYGNEELMDILENKAIFSEKDKNGQNYLDFAKWAQENPDWYI